jgi:TRAP-type mannitol/chloroaromatic compound transport system permease large subunit
LITGFYTLAGGSSFIRELMLGLPIGRWGIFIIMQAFLFIAGMFIDPTGIVMLAAPLFVPIIVDLGFSPVWFGIIFNMNMQMAYLTPPFGYAMFYLKGVAHPDITMADLYRSVWPFVGLQAVGLILVCVFPQIGMWLPELIF